MELTGERMLEPLSVTFRVEDDALYVIDRKPGGTTLRLLAISLLTNRVTVLDERVADGAFTAVSLSIGIDGNLMLVAGDRETTSLFRIALTAEGPRIVAGAKSGDAMSGAARETPDGVTFLTRVEGGYHPVVVSF